MPETHFWFSLVKGTVGTTPTAFPHDLRGGAPRLVMLSVNGAVAGVIRCTTRDATTITVVSTLASTTFEALVIQ